MQKYKLGVIGGMGSLATTLFFSKLIANTKASNDQEHIDTVILNHASMPDRTNAIINKNGMDFMKAINGDIKLLELVGVANIAIPCNTSHFYYDDLQNNTDVNIINMIQSTVKHISENVDAGSKIAVLGTNGTMQSGVYQKELIKFGFENHQIDAAIQENIMDIIYNIKADNNYQPSNLSQIIMDLVKNGCTCVILACTELSTVKLESYASACTVDALDVLVRESIILSGKEPV